ncbi:hypothetical protein [Celerinatantimonas diazotrophica]|uniref:hypothetical protein n=1 Tax=Celerinatantimonas diazotrophica TaxID=412034 RepID=UPI001044BBAF|nr:hypothetical protein [Celerinatantimonas diazotrophica]
MSFKTHWQNPSVGIGPPFIFLGMQCQLFAGFFIQVQHVIMVGGMRQPSLAGCFQGNGRTNLVQFTASDWSRWW